MGRPCDTCIHSRPALTPQGWQYLCTLSRKRQQRCFDDERFYSYSIEREKFELRSRETSTLAILEEILQDGYAVLNHAPDSRLYYVCIPEVFDAACDHYPADLVDIYCTDGRQRVKDTN